MNFGGHYRGNYIIKRLDQRDTDASDRQTRVTTTKDSYSALSTSIMIWVSATERYTWGSHRAVGQSRSSRPSAIIILSRLWRAVFTFNPYLLISRIRFIDIKNSFIDIKNSFIDINNSFIDINNSFIDINKDGAGIHLY